MNRHEHDPMGGHVPHTYTYMRARRERPHALNMPGRHTAHTPITFHRSSHTTYMPHTPLTGPVGQPRDTTPSLGGSRGEGAEEMRGVRLRDLGKANGRGGAGCVGCGVVQTSVRLGLAVGLEERRHQRPVQEARPSDAKHLEKTVVDKVLREAVGAEAEPAEAALLLARS